MTLILAANRQNTVAIGNTLMLMEDWNQSQPFSLRHGVHRVFIPSNLGGRLTVGLKPGSREGNETLSVVVPGGAVHTSDDGTVVIEFKRGDLRHESNCYVVVVAPSGHYWLYAFFDEIAFSKDGEEPLIPWNFWYWPFRAATANESAIRSRTARPLQKYERAFGVRGALDWERKHHSERNPEWKNPWEGHCDAAAKASAVFLPPPDEGLVHNGVHFTCEELKFLAAEYISRYNMLDHGWNLKYDESVRTNADGKPMVDVRSGPFQTRRPDEDREGFGGLITDFLSHVRAVLDSGRVLIMDLRDETGLDANAVWNHAVFQYRLRYWQRNRRDLRFVQGSLSLLANADMYNADGSSSGHPAEYVDGKLRPLTASRTVKCRFALRFTEMGEYALDTRDNLWYSATSARGRTFSPRYASAVLSKAAWGERRQDPTHLSESGNPLISSEHMMTLIRLRRTFGGRWE